MEQPNEILLNQNNHPIIDIDPFTQRWANESEFSISEALKKQFEQDIDSFADFLITKAGTIYSKNKTKAKKRHIQRENTAYYILGDDTDAPLLKKLQEAIAKQYTNIPEELSIEINDHYITNKKVESLIGDGHRTVIGVNWAWKYEMQFRDLLLEYYEGKSAIKDLSPEDQINVLTTAGFKSEFEASQQLKDWQACLKQLLKNAENDENKQRDVKRYVEATQAILRNPTDTQPFGNILIELSGKAEKEALIKKIVEKGVLLLLVVILGVLLAVTASINPLLPLAVFVVLFGLGVANFYGTPNNEGRLSMGISHILGKMGLFQFTEPAETAEKFRKTIPASSLKVTPTSSSD